MQQILPQEVMAQASPMRFPPDFIFVVQRRSVIRKNHREQVASTLHGLKLHGIRTFSYLRNTPTNRGMIRKVAHLVSVYNAEEDLFPSGRLRKSGGLKASELEGEATGRRPHDRRYARPRDRGSEDRRSEDTRRERDVNSQESNISLSMKGPTPTAAVMPSVNDLGEMRNKLAEAVQARDHEGNLRLLIDGAAALATALGSGIMATGVERVNAAMTGVQARAFLREYVAQLFSPDAEIAACAARIVALRAPLTRSRFRDIPLHGRLTADQSKAVAEAVADVLSAAGDRCYTRIEAVRLEPADDAGRCRLSGRVLVTKVVQAPPDGPRIALPDDGDKERARCAAIVLEIAGAENPVSLDRSDEPADEAVLVHARFETKIWRDAVDRSLPMLLIVPGIAAQRLSVEVEGM